MLNSKRIAFTIGTSVASELINKGFPLIILYYVLRKIGVQQFGEAQFGITLMEIALPFIMFGYNLHGTIIVGKNQNNVQKIGEAITDIVCCKLIHSVVILGLIIASLYFSSSHRHYISMVLAISFYLFFSAIELAWVQLGIQKMSVFSLMQVFAKIPALIGILILVDDSSDGLLYAILLLSSNALCCLMTTVYVLRKYRPAPISVRRLVQMFKSSLGFSVGLVLAGSLERIDILIAEILHGKQAIGLYAGQARLAHSINQIFLVVGSTFFSEIVSVKNELEFKRHLDVGLWTILALYFPMAIGSYFLGPSFVHSFLGQEFVDSDSVFSILTVGLISNIFVFVYGWQILYVKGQPRQVAIAMMVAASSVLGLTIFGGTLSDLSGIAFGSAIGRAVGAVLLLFFGAKFYVPNYNLMRSSLIPAIVMMFVLLATPTMSFVARATCSIITLLVVHIFINRSKIKSVFVGMNRSYD